MNVENSNETDVFLNVAFVNKLQTMPLNQLADLNLDPIFLVCGVKTTIQNGKPIMIFFND